MTTSKPFPKQFKDYVLHPESVGQGKHVFVTLLIALVLGATVYMIGRDIIHFGKLGFNIGMLGMSLLLVFTALTGFANRGHRRGNPDVEPAALMLAGFTSMVIVFLTFMKDMGVFSAVLGS